MLTRILLRRDTNENWTKHNPVLAQGELGVDVTSNLIKLGDGEKTWNELDYYSNSDNEDTLSYEELENKPYINGVELTGNVTLEDLGIIIPTRTSQLTNDSDFITSVALNQYPTASEVTEALETKQDMLTAGANIIIEDNVISATVESGSSTYKGEYSADETYYKGDIVSNGSWFYVCIKESLTNVPTSRYNYWKMITNDRLVDYLEETSDDVFHLGLIDSTVSGNSYAGMMRFSPNAPKVNAATGELIGYATESDLASKQDVLVAGSGIKIENNVISSLGGGSGGSVITIKDWSK